MPKYFLLKLLASAVSLHLAAGQAWAQPAEPVFIFQGLEWSAADRADFYTRDQGSKIIPWTWFQALRRPNGASFAENLTRYGYLSNPASKDHLPVGFMVSGSAGSRTLGMNCAACHTRQITVDGKPYRIDGGPTFADFQTFLTDLDVAVGSVLKDEAAFQVFAANVFTPAPAGPDDIATLKEDVEAWYKRYHTLMELALPKPPAQAWGPARLDAVGMIFNRLTGLDIGKPEDLFMIPDNIKVADAPTRYPFLWNVSKQDKTQWPGFADNGDDILALARNLGQVIGVFGVFEPKKDGPLVDFLNNNSANFDGLGKLEDLVKQIGKPVWPWSYDLALAAKGKDLYDNWRTPQNPKSCNDCHGRTPGEPRLLNLDTWATPVMNVGTDTREYNVLAWEADTGVLEGAFIPLITQPLKKKDTAFNALSVSVLGSIIEHTLTRGFGQPRPGGLREKVRGRIAERAGDLQALVGDGRSLLPPRLRELENAYALPPGSQGEATAPGAAPGAPGIPPLLARRRKTEFGAYEARVMEGIWAAAPYLHNGSVPTLADLLKPPDERPASFKIGPAYDRETVGLAIDQPQSTFTLQTTNCSNINSGNSRCGHPYGTTLSPEQKRELLEYLKIL
ncbi:MAG TPA: di-heme-cytochrome C peroxidase [Beijerinckiaceae bacterium]